MRVREDLEERCARILNSLDRLSEVPNLTLALILNLNLPELHSNMRALGCFSCFYACLAGVSNLRALPNCVLIILRLIFRNHWKSITMTKQRACSQKLVDRVRVDPFNLVGTLIFLMRNCAYLPDFQVHADLAPL